MLKKRLIKLSREPDPDEPDLTSQHRHQSKVVLGSGITAAPSAVASAQTPSLREDNSDNSIPTAASQVGNQNRGKPAHLWLPAAKQGPGPSRGCSRGSTRQSRAKHWPLTHSTSARLWGQEIQSMARGKHWESENRSVSVFIKTDKQEIPLDPVLPCSSPTSGDSGAGWILQPPIPPSLQEQFVSSSLSP